MSLSSDLYKLATERIRAEQDEAVTLEDVRVTPGNEENSFMASAVVMEEIDDSVRNPNGSDELQEYLNARTESWMTEVEIVDETVATWVTQTINEFVENITLSSNATETSDPELRFVDESDLRLLMDVTVTPVDVSSSLSDARIRLDETSQMIPSEESLRTMTVRLTDFNYDEDDWSTPHHDFTIYFATDEPHTYWANCDTLEEYFEMVADNNDETTVEEMRDKDEYYSHTHLMNNKSEVIDWLETFTTSLTDEHITTTEDITVFPYRLEVDFETEEVTLQCDLRKKVS